METEKLKILAIDDIPDNLLTLKAIISDVLPGATVFTASDGLQGIELARAEDPDVILLDIVMPSLDGFEVCRIIKKDKRLQMIPVLFLTALKTGREIRIKGIEAGAEAFLSKPFDDAELMVQIQAMAKIKERNMLLNAQKEQLESLVAQRTFELKQEINERIESEKRILALVDELKQADKNKNEFLNALSHELRNPLATIVGGLSLLDLSTDKEQTDKAKEIMKRQIDHLCHLVDDLLDITRITRNKITLKKEKLELNKVASSTVEDYKMLFREKGVKIITEINKNSIYIDADPVRLTQIIGNLLHNALNFTERNGYTLLSIHEEEGEAVICVKDSGIGIKPEFLPYIFEPFKQADISLSRCNGGLGLGLSIAKGIAELHGGSVHVNSEGPGKGSSFYIRLPMLQNKEEKKETKQIYSGEARLFRILLIEDNRDFANILCSMLVILGHEVITAYGGIEGLEKAKEFLPDIVFCDIGLPCMDGFEVARRIRSEDKLKDVFLIALTGYAGQRDIKLSMESGFNRHLGKPMDIAILKRVLAEV